MIYYSIAAIGLCFILKYGTILNFLRNFLTSKSQKMKELFDCSLCLGFWCGVLLLPLLVLLEDYGIKILLFPLVSSCICWTHDLLLRYVRALIYNEEKE
jgi:hypothetical protein